LYFREMSSFAIELSWYTEIASCGKPTEASSISALKNTSITVLLSLASA